MSADTPRNHVDVAEMKTVAASIAARALEISPADQTEAVVAVTSSALTRFAENRIHQNVAEKNAEVSVRAVLGTRTGVASTNRTDDDSLAACCEAALAAARSAPEDSGFPGLPDASASGSSASGSSASGVTDRVDRVDRVEASTAAFDAEARALAARAIIDQSSNRSLSCAGGVRSSVQAIAVGNTRGATDAQATAGVRATVLSMSADEGSGWAAYCSRSAAGLAAEAIGDEAATIAERSASPTSLDPGSYTVVLAPEAVADLLEFLGYLGFGAKAFHEERSFMSRRLGERVVSERISIADDARAAHAFGLEFDFEGVPKRRVPLIDNGVAIGVVTDSYWASRTGMDNTGHALPAPNPYGPMPLNLEMAPGDAAIDDLITAVDHGVYVTRFHYVNVEDPVPVTLTGMTRDGTFLIEGGRLTRPLKNLRFTQSVIAALEEVHGVTRDRAWVGSETSPVLVPGLLLGSFVFTGQTRDD